MPAPFDLRRLETTGPAVPILYDVVVSGAGVALYDLSDDGTLAYYTRFQFPLREVVWVDRSGDAEAVVEASRFQSWARLSPDENRILMAIRDEQGASSIWTYDLTRQAISRLTFRRRDARPVWSPDGSWAAYQSTRDGKTAIYRKRADGSGEAELLMFVDYGGALVPQAFSPDGAVLAFTSLYGGNDLGFMDVGGGTEPAISVDPDSEQLSPAFSPSGSWVAYVSSESGRYEVYVRDYPDAGGKWQISVDGGQEPVWSRDGGELFFRNGYKMMAVPIEPGPRFTFGQPLLLFEGTYELPDNRLGPTYDVSSDGRFLMLRRVGEKRPTEIRVVLNFDEELKRLVPAN